MVAKHLLTTSDTVERIAIMDIDAHHGDGTEALLGPKSSALTFSVHDSTAFPWTGHDDDPETATYNRALDGGSGDAELLQAVQDFMLSHDIGPTWCSTAITPPTHWHP